jgi:prolyl oligopeptidase
MRYFLILILSILTIIKSMSQNNYPVTKTVDSIDILWGKTYKDPYRWVEDLKSEEVKNWYKDQNSYTNSILDKITNRDKLIERYQELENILPPKLENLCYEGGRYFYKKANAGEKVAKLYFKEGLNGQEILLFDPAIYIPGKTLSIKGIKPSYDGKKIAMWYSADGSEVSTIRVLDVDKKSFLPDVIYPTWGGVISWAFDNQAFTYYLLNTDDFNDINFSKNVKNKYHKIGDDIKNDVDIYSTESYPGLSDPADEPFAGFNKDSKKYLFVDLWSTQSEWFTYYAKITPLDQKLDWKILCKPSDGIIKDRIIINDNVYAISTKNAKKYKLVHTTLLNPNWDKADIIVAENKDKTLEGLTLCKDFLILNYSDGINNSLFKYNLNNKELTEIQMPLKGTAYTSCLDNSTNQCIVSISSWTNPPTEFMLDAKTNLFSPSIFRQAPTLPKEYEDLVTEEVQVKGHDGEMIPLSIIYKKGLKKDGLNVCSIEGYGAYGYSFFPYFNKKQLPLAVYYNVVLAVAHVRGGGEKGNDWHTAGMKAKKPNSWKDLNSCAEYLINNGFTSKIALAVTGTSAGGSMVTRAMTERPDLYAAVICNVGDPNSLRSEFSQSGAANIPEFGTIHDSVECASLAEMDAYQHIVKEISYPAVICVGGWNDPRVPVWQPAKFAAALQNASGSNKPVLLKVNFDNGHFTEDKSVTFKNFADQFAFAMWQCGHRDFKLKKAP